MGFGVIVNALNKIVEAIKALTIATGGGGASANDYKARVFLTGPQSINTTTWTTVQFDTELYDPNGDFDHVTNYDYTIPVTGYYFINATIKLSVNVASQRFNIRLRKNGSSTLINNSVHTSATYSVSAVMVDVIYLTAGDILIVQCAQYTGSSQNLGTGTAQTYFVIYNLI